MSGPKPALSGLFTFFLQADQGSFVLLNKFPVHTPTEDQVSISFETSLLQDIPCGTLPDTEGPLVRP